MSLEEDRQLNELPTEGSLARDSLRAIGRSLALQMHNDMNDEISVACTDMRMHLSHAGALPEWCPRARRGYQSPWTHLEPNRLQKDCTQPDEWSDRSQYTRKEFADTLNGAIENVPCISRIQNRLREFLDPLDCRPRCVQTPSSFILEHRSFAGEIQNRWPEIVDSQIVGFQTIVTLTISLNPVV